MSADNYQRSIKTVSQITKEIKSLFEHRYQFVRISGEISNLRRPHSGHHYFNLKDENAQIRAVLFKNQSRYLDKQLSDGQQIICDGRVTIYEPRGEYQIIIDSVDFCGLGHLQIAFEQLKSKLLGEGLFNQELKAQIPHHIEKIILITSPTGAAVHDFLSVCYKRKANLSVQILPVRVQGEGSATEIAAALQRADDLKPDVIVLSRGGGSIEDLWAFNEECVARAIFKNSVPVVSAVGHEIDITIADYCADVRSATPTAAAELLVVESGEIQNRIERMIQRIARTVQWQLEAAAYRVSRADHLFSTFDSAFYTKTMQLDTLRMRLADTMSSLIIHKRTTLDRHTSRLEQLSPLNALTLHGVKLEFCRDKLRKGIQFQLDRTFSRFQETIAVLDSVSPLATLSRGYSIVSNPLTGETISDVKQVNTEDSVDVRLHKGKLLCRIVRRG
jgi:exodeoxyribonuclease VII large subunit